MRGRRYSEADLRAMIPLYLDGALNAADRAQVEAYYLQHPEVLAEFGESSRMIDLLDEAVTVRPVDSGFTSDVMAAVERLTPLERVRRQGAPCPPVTALRWAAEAALLITLLLLLWMHPWAPPINPLECHLLGDENWTLGQPAAVRVIVRHEARSGGLPSATVHLRLHRERWRRTLLRARTNDQGTIDADLQLDPDITAGSYLLVGEVEALGARAVVSHRVRILPRVRIALEPIADSFTVGEPVRVRVTAIDGAQQPADEALPWRLTNHQGVVLSAGTVTPRRGQVLLEIATSPRLTAGRLELLVQGPHGVVSRQIGLVPRQPEELRVEAGSAPASAIAGQALTVEVTVLTPAGVPVAGARTRAVLKATTGRSEVVGQSSDSGVWRCRLTAPGGEGWASLHVEATSRSRLGALDRMIRLAGSPVDLALTVPGTVVAGLDSPLLLAASLLDGSPYDGELQVSLNGGRSRRHYPRGGLLELLVRPGPGRNALLVTVPRYPAATRRFSFYATDRSGLVVRPARRRTVAGEALRVELLAAGRTPEAYLDLVGAQTLATRSLHLKNGRRGEIVVYPPSGAGGRVLLRAYARQGSTWRVGWTSVWVEDPAPGRVDLVADPATPGGIAARAVTPDGTAISTDLILAASTGAPPATPAPRSEPTRQSFQLLANSAHQARQEALASQQRFFDRSGLLGGAVGALLLAVVILWLAQVFGDPFEYVAPHERRAWGRVPQVHRRGAWAGYGALLMGVLVAGGVTAGILLAGYQARELAASATEPLGTWYPRLRTAIAQSAGLAEAGLRAASVEAPRGASPRAVEVARREAAETPAQYSPASTQKADWRIAAFASTRLGPLPAAAVGVETPGQLTLSWAPPERMRLGDQVSVPIELDNPTSEAVTAHLQLEADGPLTIQGGRRRTLVVPARSTRTTELRCRASATGTSQLRLHRHAPAPATSWAKSVEIGRAEWRSGQVLAGFAGSRTDQTLALAGGGRLLIEAWAEPLLAWDEALGATAKRPAEELREVLGSADAALLRYQLWESTGHLPTDELARLRQQAAEEAQAALSFALPNGSFATRRGGAGSLVASAESLILLRRLAQAEILPPASLAATRRYVGAGLERLREPAQDRPPDHLAVSAWCAYALAEPAADNGPGVAGLDGLVSEVQETEISYLLAVLANAAGIEWNSDRARPLLRRLAGSRNRRSDGSNWFQSDQRPLSGTVGRGAAIEATALAVLACSRSEDGRLRAVARDGARYLARAALSDGTWGSTWLTSLALRAILAADPPPTAARGLLLVELDGARVGRISVGPGTHYRQAVELPAGEHAVRLRFYGRGRPGYRFETSAGGPEPSGLQANLTAPARLAPWQPLELRIDCRNPTALAVPALAVDLPLPAGFRLRQPSPSRSMVNGRLIVLAGPLPPRSSRRLTVVLHPTTSNARLVASEGYLRALHDPSLGARLRLPALTVGR